MWMQSMTNRLRHIESAQIHDTEHQKRQSRSNPGPDTNLRQIKQRTIGYHGNETNYYLIAMVAPRLS